MPEYIAPLAKIAFFLDEIAGLGQDIASGEAGELSQDLVDGILSEAARFAQEQLSPQNWPGDQIGAIFANNSVTMPPGWQSLYKAWAEAGWNGVDLPAEWGGMGLPTRMATATMEMWTSACMSFALGPVLAQGAVDTLERHASTDLKEQYLPKLVSGEWTATMNLTEPQAGSDVGALRTRAVAQGDGSYRITGNKIYITYGEHDLADNIIHLVLARLTDAPQGSKGISLFLVPKFLLKSDGSPSEHNDVLCTGIEHKLGIHASPTCSMAYGEKGGAIGWLVGEENRGLNCMFTMMNKARLFTGLQGVAIAERAYQQALDYARTRRQGRALNAQSDISSLIIAHPDVRRNLMLMRAQISAARAIAYRAAQAIDHAQNETDPAKRKLADELAGLLTPITKSYCSDIGVDVTSIGVQIHGGMGYVEETGAAQHFRDSRITPIYEGTNGIQAIDLVMRKVLRPGSTIASEVIARYKASAMAATGLGKQEFGELGSITHEATEALEKATNWLRQNQNDAPALLASASPYLRLFSLAEGCASLADAAMAATRRHSRGETHSILAEIIADARFYAENFGVAAPSLARMVMQSSVPDVKAFGAL